MLAAAGMKRGPLQPDEPVVFLDRDQRDHFALLAEGKKVNIRGHLIPFDDLIGEPDGSVARSNKGGLFRCFRTTLELYSRYMKRHAQIIVPKDTATIVMYADLFPGARVVEGGFGSGALSLGILRAIGATGQLTTYELREEAANRSRKNVAGFMGETPHHTVRIADIYEGIQESDVDRVVLDVPEPWSALEASAEALVDGGVIAAYVPTALQLHQLVMAMREQRRWARIRSMEMIFRPWFVNAKSCRPEQKIIGHTGFLAFARRVARLPARTPAADPGTVQAVDASDQPG